MGTCNDCRFCADESCEYASNHDTCDQWKPECVKHSADYKLGYAAGLKDGQSSALTEGTKCWVIMRVGFSGKTEDPSLWRTRFWYSDQKDQAEMFAMSAYVEDVEVRPAWIIVGDVK